MPKNRRIKTGYPGVFYIEGKRVKNGKREKIYYISYRKDGQKIEEKAGKQFKDEMSPAKANNMRSRKIDGSSPTNEEKRKAEEETKRAESDRWTIDRLWESYKENKASLKDVKNDQNRFDNYIQPEFGNGEPKDLVPPDVERLKRKLLKKKAPATVKNILELLRRIVNYGAKNLLCPGIGFTIEMPKVDNLQTEDLNPDQLSKLLKAIDEDSHPQAGTMMKMALFTGMRRGELFKLKWKHIDFERGFINIVDPKGGKDQVIPLNDLVRDLLENHPRTKSSFIFPGRGGRQRTDINKAVNAIKKAAGLPKNFRALHGLRHTYASSLASSGKVDLYTLQKLLTHRSPQMTIRYAHLRDDALKAASNVASEIFKPKENEKVIELDRK